MNDKVDIAQLKRQYFINPSLSDEGVLREVKSIKDTLATTVPKDGRFRVSSAVFYYFILLVWAILQIDFFPASLEIISYTVASYISTVPLALFAFNRLKHNKSYSIPISLVYSGVLLMLRYILEPFAHTHTDLWTETHNWWTRLTEDFLVIIIYWHVILAFIISILKRIDRFK